MPKITTVFRPLRRRIEDAGYYQTEVATEIGKSAPYLSARMNGKKPFDADDITKICNLCGIGRGEIGALFFPAVPDESQTVRL